MATIPSKFITDLSKLEPLDGSNYKRWSQKLLIFFEQLEIDYVLVQDCPEPIFDVTADATVTPPPAAVIKKNEDEIRKHEKENKIARFLILNHMVNSMFDLFMVHKSAKTIWKLLEKKYGADDAGQRKYVVHVYENLCADVLNEDMKMCEIFQANVLLEKFSPSWSDYRNHLKHKKRDLTEEANRLKDKSDSVPINRYNANLVESGGSSKDRFKGKGRMVHKQGQKLNHNKFTKPIPKVQKPDLVCYVCGKPGHKAYKCVQRHGPQNKPNQNAAQVNLAEQDDIIAAVVVEANLVANITDWILDTGASRHLCASKELYYDFKDVADGECVYMGNSATAGVNGKGKILLKLSSRKTLSLSNVLYVLTLRRNLVSGALLNKAEFSMRLTP
ncbi:hypothetical protein RND81_13G196800 [Saponaria officinalis]|uniref:CCHC-type domain-containing protein n=1 Tax=Saponaria officinalis TaxID=3572 RepID=A0AAW1H6I8_SAPOF